jgi:hypothetical protein
LTTATRTQIGSRENAELIAKIRDSYDGLSYDTVPNGWEYLAYRAVVGPDGVVYKARFAAYEADTFQFVKDRGYAWAPEFTYYEEFDVVAMKYYEVTRERPTGDNLDRWTEMKSVVSDTHTGNIGYDENGDLFLIDGDAGTKEE